MDEVPVAALLREASTEVPVHEPPTRAIMRAGRHRAAWRRAGAAASLFAVAATVVSVARLDRTDSRPGPPPPASPPAAGPVNTGCVGRPVPALLPEWARAGFTDPEPWMRYVTSSSGELVAILFSDALYAPPRPNQSNKILWVTPIASGSRPMTITAQRDGTSQTVTREVPEGPGPSTVDLPSAGCWHLTLRWGKETDVIDLRYVSP